MALILNRHKGNWGSWFSDPSQSFNKYANHPAIVKAILCAGLYPNVAATEEGIHAPAVGNLRQHLKPVSKGNPAWFDGRREVYIHPSSVNGGSKAFQHPFLVFLEKVEPHKVFLRDTTIISPYSLLLFGGAINVQHQVGLVTVDGWLKISAPAQTGVLFKQLRLTLQSVLDDLIKKPQVFSEKAFEKLGKYFISMHFSDQQSGPHKKKLMLKFALPDIKNMSEMTRLVALVPYYIDFVGRYKLSSQARSKTDGARVKVAQEVYKELQNARQETVQRKKADRRKMLEEGEAKMSAEAIRKKDAKERARQTKKGMPKMKMSRA